MIFIFKMNIQTVLYPGSFRLGISNPVENADVKKNEKLIFLFFFLNDFILGIIAKLDRR